MSQVQACGHIDTTPGSWISSNNNNNLVNPEINFMMASSTSSEGLLTQSYQDLQRFRSMNQTNGSSHLVLLQEIQITPSTSSHNIISGQGMDSMVEAPFWGQFSVRGQPSPGSYPKSAIQTKDGTQIANAAVDPRQPVDRDIPIPNRPPTTEDWRAYRHIFTQLYSVENKTLKEVVGIMKEQYHFRAR
jgi:hypothetical protein